MSGIYIKGVEMPTSCFDCKMRTAVGCCGNLPHNTRMPNCPIFPVSEGRMNDAVVHGHWIGSEINGFDRCSNCKAIWDISLTKRNMFFRYCPRCGALMDEVVTE